MIRNQVMKSGDAISGSLAECFVTIEGKRLFMIQMINVEASVTKSKTEVPILGKVGKGHKATGWVGTGKGKLHYNTSVFRQMLLKYKDTGQDIYFDMQITNEDPTSTVGRQTVILKGCNLDGGLLAKFDADAEYIDEDVEFTFDDFLLPETFRNLKGM